MGTDNADFLQNSPETGQSPKPAHSSSLCVLRALSLNFPLVDIESFGVCVFEISNGVRIVLPLAGRSLLRVCGASSQNSIQTTLKGRKN